MELVSGCVDEELLEMVFQTNHLRAYGNKGTTLILLFLHDGFGKPNT